MSPTRLTTLAVLTTLVGGVCVNAQAPPTTSRRMPPDVGFIQAPSCTLLKHGVGDSVDAKTGEVTEIFLYRVEPYAIYRDGRERWELPQETISHGTERRPGAIADAHTIGEAASVCEAWIDEVKRASAEEQRKVLTRGVKK